MKRIVLFLSGVAALIVAAAIGVGIAPFPWLVVLLVYGAGILCFFAVLVPTSKKDKENAVLGALLFAIVMGTFIYQDFRLFLMATIIILTLLSRLTREEGFSM